MPRFALLFFALLLLRPVVAAPSSESPLLLQKPTVSAHKIVFAYAGDLWIVDRDGGDAQRLTTGVGVETSPHFSPDGTRIAFTGQYDGNTDVYVVPATGGVPERVTWHPAPDNVVGWTPDGQRILFASNRNNPNGVPRLFTVPMGGGMPDLVPLPVASEGSYSPDGTRLAYVPGMQQGAWKRYRGGQTTPVWIADLATSQITQRAPRNNTNDFCPMWVGSCVYFLSDRDSAVSLFCYDTGSKKVTSVIKNDGLDIKSASAGAGAIVYERFGAIHLLDLTSGRSRPVPIRVVGDLPEVRPHFVKVSSRISGADLSPSGVRAVFAARGEIFTVPAEKGDARNLTNTPGANERDPAWSPDGKWIVYTRQLPSYLGAVFAYSLDDRKTRQLTDGLSDAQSARFDRSGKYLFFTASTDVGLGVWFADMSAMDRPVSRSVYVMVLRKGVSSPLAPESDEEKIAEEKSAEDKPKEEPAKAADKTPEPVRIDADNIGQRILALPIPARNYVALATGKEGVLFLQEAPVVRSGPQLLHRFDLKTRKTDKLLDSVGAFVVSANGEKLMFQQGSRWAIASTTGTISPGAGALNLDNMEAYVDPPVEWRQMYHEAWRGLRDFFYDPNLHGLNLTAMETRYAPYLDRLASRDDLNYLFREMLGEVTISHMGAGGGDSPEARRVGVGLLGADYAIENGRYRFTRVYNGENWNPDFRAPLTQPGVDIAPGEYLLEVNGREVSASDEVYKFFEGTAGKQTTLKVGPNPNGTGAREVIVVPAADERQLRYLAWIEDNRRFVDKMSGGKLAYVHLPDTSLGGYTSFNRYYFAQSGRLGAIVDERFNGGGALADYVIDNLRRPLAAFFTQREGDDFAMPTAAIFGPKTMLINEFAGSGGDYMPWAFRDAKIGPLVGKRTWGGLVGVSGVPLLDGGFTGAPQSGLWNPNGTWDVENWGVEPDIEVEMEMDPAAWRAGRDPQLEKAVEVTLEALKKSPPPTYKKPAYPNYHNNRPVAPRRPGDAARGT